MAKTVEHWLGILKDPRVRTSLIQIFRGQFGSKSIGRDFKKKSEKITDTTIELQKVIITHGNLLFDGQGPILVNE